MNETTQKLIRELADKLGTTTQHLWEVLVRQAPITSAVDGLILAASWIIAIYLAKAAMKKDWDDSSEMAIGGVMSIVSLVFFLVAISCTYQYGALIVSGFFNPEYWALSQFKIIK